MALLNLNNFIRWHDGTADAAALPRPYERESGFYAPAVMLVYGETYRLYFNSTAPLSTPTSLVLVRPSGNVALTHTTTKFEIGGSGSGLYHATIQFTLPAGIAPGTYALLLNGLYTSNYVEVMTAAEAALFTALVEFSHNQALGDFYYPYVPAFKQKLRLRLALREQQPQTEAEVYQSTLDGRYRNLQGTTREYIILETPEYHTLDHRAAKLLSLHDNITINGTDYNRKPDSSYTITPDPGSPYSTGEFGLYENGSTILFTA